MSVLAIGGWRTNGEMIQDVATLGYLDGKVLDATYGEGGFWTHWRPADLTANANEWDFCELPFPDWTFSAVVFDPPYRLNGTPDLGPFDQRYGVQHKATWQSRHKLMKRGLRECIRVTAPGGYVLGKCQAQVCSGKVRWQDRLMSEWGEAEGCELVDRFDLVTHERKQPDGRRQVHARRNHSTLLVLQTETSRPRRSGE